MLRYLALSAAAVLLLAVPPSVQAQSTPAPASAPAPAPDPARLRADVEALVGFGTRHTLSDPDDPKRGIGAARRWAAERFRAIAKSCNGCIRVETIERRFTGPRAPDGVNVVDVLGIQPGSGDPDEVIIVSAHIDSRASDPLDAKSDAPGANDDGSGTALVIEAARLLSRERFGPTIIYAVLSGEEQGLWGGTLLADTARARGWRVRAQLNNDIVGNTRGQDGRIVDDRVRVFSEGIRAAETLDEAMARRNSGGEDDGPSRALMRAVRRVAAERPDIALEVFGVRRPDRFARGGDHLPFLDRGYPAVRFTVGVENYDRQHQDVRQEGGRAFGDTVEAMDFAYLAKVTALNVAVLRALASAPAAPESAVLAGAVSSDTSISWTPVPGAAGYRVYWRRADRQDWEEHRDTEATELVLPGVIVDDTFFGVAALGRDGAESMVTFAGLPPRR